MARRITLVLLGCALVPGLVACGNTEGETATAPARTGNPPAQLFDPCAGIPDDALAAAGLDPATEKSGVGGVRQPGWEICGWQATEFTLGVFSTGAMVDKLENQPSNTEVQDVTIAGRTGRQFRVDGASKDHMCDVLFPAAQGVLQLTLVEKSSDGSADEPCADLSRVGESIVPMLPR